MQGKPEFRRDHPTPAMTQLCVAGRLKITKSSSQASSQMPSKTCEANVSAASNTRALRSNQMERKASMMRELTIFPSACDGFWPPSQDGTLLRRERYIDRQPPEQACPNLPGKGALQG
jgi:hypothetical protein